MEDYKLKRPEDFSDPPSIALYMIVKNAESVIERTLKNVAPYVRELFFVLNDTTDGTEQKIIECSQKYFKAGTRLTISRLKWSDKPEFYFLDNQYTYLHGRPFGNEEYCGPFTENPILCNWAGLRNYGWDMETACQWKLFLDADDTIKDPENLYGACDLLNQHGADLGLSLYQYNVQEGRVYGQLYRERLVKNSPEIRWTGEVHETITGHKRAAVIEGCLIVVDNKDNKGDDTRIPDRDFKVLYRKGRMSDWNLSSREFFLIGREAALKMPQLALDFLLSATRLSRYGSDQSELAIAIRLQAVIYTERFDKHEMACLLFKKSFSVMPSSKTAFMACSSLYKLKKYGEVLKSYEVGCHIEDFPHRMPEEGPGYKELARIPARAALTELRRDLDFETVNRVIEIFPSHPSVKTIREEIETLLEKVGL